MKKLFLAVALVFCLVGTASAQSGTMGGGGHGGGGDWSAHPSSFYVELLGPAGVYSFNFDYRLAQMFAARVGIEFFSFGGATVIILPVTGSVLLGNGPNFFEIGGGADVAVGGGFGDTDAGLAFLLIAGYRYQPVGGFMFRAGMTHIVNSGMAAWPYLSFGVNF